MAQRSAQASTLVGDVGSTHARFAIADATGRLSHVERYAIAEFADAGSLLTRYLDALAGMRLDAVSLALAGPLEGRRITLSNAGLTFDADDAAARTGCDDVHLINDFEAVAHAIPELEPERLRRIGGDAPAAGTKAALGPGTGLGMGIVTPQGGNWHVIASEGGHATLAPRDALELELLAIVMREHDPVCWETLLSGPGLLRLYRSLCQLWGCAPELDSQEEVTQRAVTGSDPVCQQTLELFCSMLGTAAGDLALMVGARGGIYIAGGIVPQITEFLAASPFRERFEQRGPLTDLCRRIPVLVIDEPRLGLRGAFASYRRAREDSPLIRD